MCLGSYAPDDPRFACDCHLTCDPNEGPEAVRAGGTFAVVEPAPPALNLPKLLELLMDLYEDADNRKDAEQDIDGTWHVNAAMDLARRLRIAIWSVRLAMGDAAEMPDDYPLTVKEHRLHEPEAAEKPWTCPHCHAAHDPWKDCDARKQWLAERK
jgi:hypothetical protein